MRQLQYDDKNVECGATIYNPKRNIYGCYCGKHIKDNITFDIIHWDCNIEPSKINLLNLEKRGLHLFVVE